MRTGRGETRILVANLGLLELLGKPRDSERAWIENISDHGARLIARRAWRAGERLLISSRCPPFRSTAASVVYCQSIPGGLYAVGCESTSGGLTQLLDLRVASKTRTDIHAGKVCSRQDPSATI
ncbi:MAG TPA: hypothetical protein VNI81_07410 [Candidatus Limnocylindrales bacterium]|jgi:hypothetical protein|nr:hypothetical protein [Candidatus Limnocylindrales bacterium]